MNKYNQSALSNKGRRKIFEEAKLDGVIIQQKTTAGEVVSEFILRGVSMSEWTEQTQKDFDDIFETGEKK